MCPRAMPQLTDPEDICRHGNASVSCTSRIPVVASGMASLQFDEGVRERKKGPPVRVLFSTPPLTGHLHPLVPLARSLVAAGHDIAFASAAAFCPTIEAIGFRCFPAGIGWGTPPPALPGPPPPIGGPRWKFWITDLAPPMIEDLAGICDAWHPDLLVRDTSEYGACVVGESRGIPCASVAAGAMVSDYRRRWEIAAHLAWLRERYGLAPDPEVEMPFRFLTLAFMPRRFHDATHAFCPTTHFFRPDLFDRSGDEDLPTWVAALPNQPTVYATLGTLSNHRIGTFTVILDALRDEPLTLVLTIGRDGDPARFGAQPANVHIERYIPQSLLLPYCDLMVCQAGFSTVMGALSAGLPVVAFPIEADQPVHAARVAALALGRVIEPADIIPATVQDAVRAVLADPTYRTNAERVRDEIAALPGPDRAVELLERLEAEKQPLLTA